MWVVSVGVGVGVGVVGLWVLAVCVGVWVCLCVALYLPLSFPLRTQHIMGLGVQGAKPLGRSLLRRSPPGRRCLAPFGAARPGATRSFGAARPGAARSFAQVEGQRRPPCCILPRSGSLAISKMRSRTSYLPCSCQHSTQHTMDHGGPGGEAPWSHTGGTSNHGAVMNANQKLRRNQTQRRRRGEATQEVSYRIVSQSGVVAWDPYSADFLNA